jgi:DNA-binding transcriptional regulator WhiA
MPTKQIIQKPGKKYYRIIFSSLSIANSFESLESDPEAVIQDTVNFKCSACEQAFVRGVFISSAKINDPQKGYSLEFFLSTENISRTSKLYRFLSFSGFVSKIVNRSNGSGLYYKNNTMRYTMKKR